MRIVSYIASASSSAIPSARQLTKSGPLSSSIHTLVIKAILTAAPCIVCCDRRWEPVEGAQDAPRVSSHGAGSRAGRLPIIKSDFIESSRQGPLSLKRAQTQDLGKLIVQIHFWTNPPPGSALWAHGVNLPGGDWRIVLPECIRPASASGRRVQIYVASARMNDHGTNKAIVHDGPAAGKPSRITARLALMSWRL
jgi:hypothetical protein